MTVHHSMVSYYHNVKKALERTVTLDSLIYNRQVRDQRLLIYCQKSTSTTILSSSGNQTHAKGSREEPMRLMILGKWLILCVQTPSIQCMWECTHVCAPTHHTDAQCISSFMLNLIINAICNFCGYTCNLMFEMCPEWQHFLFLFLSLKFLFDPAPLAHRYTHTHTIYYIHKIQIKLTQNALYTQHKNTCNTNIPNTYTQ